MERLYNGYTIELSEGAFPLSTDSIALSEFVRLPKNARVLDLGSGCGTLGMLLCALDSNCIVTGIEQDENAHRMAQHNAHQNRLESRIESICGDIRCFSDLVRAGSFSCCISNPPYFSAGPSSQSLPLARHDDLCNMDELMRAAAYALKYGGDFFLVHKPERLAELFSTASKYHLEPKRLRLLRHRENGPVSLVLVQCRKGAKPGITWEEESLHLSDGTPTTYYNSLYHL